MKINLKKWLGLTVCSAILLAGFDSCVKNRNTLATDFSQAEPLVELLTAPPLGATPTKYKGLVLNLSQPSVTERIYVNYAAGGPAPKDIKVTLAIDPTGLAAFNLAQSPNTNYVLLSPNAYSFNTTVIIRKGEQFGYADITFKPGLVDLSVSNALAIKIVDAEGVLISGNYHTFIYSVGVKSPYEGVYSLRGFILRAGDPVLTGPTGVYERTLLTVSANSVRMAENHGWSASSGPGAIASTVSNPTYSVDPATNLVTITSDGGPFPAGMMNLPGNTSRYDPATKTFYVYSTWGGGPGVREMKDTLTFLRPTP